MGCHALPQIFLTQGSNLPLSYLPHWQGSSSPLPPSGKPSSQGTFEEITSSLSLCLSVLTCVMGVKPRLASSISGCGVATETEGVKFVQQENILVFLCE